MAAVASVASPHPEKPALISHPSVTNERSATALAELKALCEKNQIYWPASEIEGYPAEGHNDDDSLLYASYTSSPCATHLTHHLDGFSLHARTTLRLLTSSTAPQQSGVDKQPS